MVSPLVVLGQTGQPLYRFNGEIQIGPKLYDISPESRLAHVLFFPVMDARGVVDKETGYAQEPQKLFFTNPLAYFDARSIVRRVINSESDSEGCDDGRGGGDNGSECSEEEEGDQKNRLRRRHVFGQKYAWWNSQRAVALADPNAFL